jgi:photosystem II stability/assembly factor-like uncharacterized protein
MIRMSCADVRLALQEPHEAEMLRLERHIAECPACTQAVADWRRADAAIVQMLERRAPRASVARTVRARLEAESRPTIRRPRHRWFPLHMRALAFAMPLAVVAVVVAVAMPQYATHLHETDTHAAPWNTKNYDAPYPITVDAARPGHLLVGAAGRVYESFNQGRAWHALAPLPGKYNIRDLAIDRTDPSRYLVAANHTVLISSDAGAHWSIAVDGLTGAFNMFLVQDRQNPATFYVGPSILWKSANHGGTWAPDGRGLIFGPYGIQALAQSGSTLYTGITGGGVAVSHDGGVTWTRPDPSFMSTVFDVSVADGTVWAATKAGVYRSIDGAQHWTLDTPHDHFVVNNVFAEHGLVLAGGIGALYRSTDGGRRWHLGMDGFPPGPYVYALTADPTDPNRIYASLDSDGVFRSDDGGRTWTAASAGLPLHVVQSNQRAVLFLRGGVLWHTTVEGADPGNLTVVTDVRRAAVAPDNSGAAYLAGVDGNWHVDLVSVGARAHTLVSGAGPLPRRLLWSSDATRVAVAGKSAVHVGVLNHHAFQWPLTTSQRVEGWTPDNNGLWIWDAHARTLTPRFWKTGAPLGAPIGPFQRAPHVAPNGTALAVLSGGQLAIGTTGNSMRPVASFPSSCRLGTWSDDSARVLVRCGSTVSLVSRTGTRTDVHVAGRADWLPGTHDGLIIFHRGALLEWLGGQPRPLIANAEPAS